MDFEPKKELGVHNSGSKRELEVESIPAPPERVSQTPRVREEVVRHVSAESPSNLALDQTGFEISSEIRRNVTQHIVKEDLSAERREKLTYPTESRGQLKRDNGRTMQSHLLRSNRVVLEESILDKAISWIAEVLKALDRMIFRKPVTDIAPANDQSGALSLNKKRKRSSLDDEEGLSVSGDGISTEQDSASGSASGGANLAGR